jgi:autotransporter-associated beta strand protein
MVANDCLPDDVLNRYATGELSEAEARVIDTHLGQCSHCLGRLDDLAVRADSILAALRQPREAAADNTPPVLSRAVAAVLAGTVRLGPEPGTVLNGYRILEEVGRGGMGRVYRAAHPRLDQEVALKLLRPGTDSASILTRFEVERQALARMDHPNIARVLDGGATEDGQPFFVMELVRGVCVTRYCDEHRLDLGRRLELFISVCQAVQHAHQKGVIHRDLKPSNVLVAEYDGRPVPKVIDFSVARAIDAQASAATEVGMLVGTPEYMSPEQADVVAQDIDTRSDIYALGMLLYELLTGETPFARRLRGAPLLEVLRTLREEEPPAPSARLKAAAEQVEVAARRAAGPDKLVKQVRGELDWVVLKALEKDRSRRYETAAALAEDVRRYLNDEPVQAGPPSRVYRLKKFLRRNRGGVLAGANSYSSFTRVLEGTVNIRHPSALGTAAGTGDQTNVFPGAILELQGGITVAAEILALTAPNVGETIVRSTSGNNTWAGSISLERPATFDVASASELTISGVISGGLSSTLTKDGTGRLILSAANTYSGQTVVGLGFLNIRNGSALGSTQNGTLVTDGVLELESATGIAVGAEALSSDGAALGFDVVRNKSGNNSWAGPIDLGPDTTTFRVDDTSQLTLRGIVSGGADEDLLKRGTGTLVLTEANTYQGVTTIFEEILTIRDAEALGSSVGDTRVQGTGATLAIDGDFDVVGEALRLNGSGVQGLGGSSRRGNTSSPPLPTGRGVSSSPGRPRFARTPTPPLCSAGSSAASPPLSR